MGATNQTIYDVNYQGVETNLTPPNHRTPKWLAWLYVLLYPLQWIHNNFFNDYANGSDYPFYSNTATYNIGDRVIDVDNAAYECEFNNVFNYSPHLNIGIAIGSYRFISNGGTDNLGSGSGINAINFSGSSAIGYHIYIGSSGATFTWDDSQGNRVNVITIVPGRVYQLSYDVTIVFTAGTFEQADDYYFTISNSTVWWQVSPDYRGVRPRTNFNGQKLVLEGILNQFFRTTFREPATGLLPDIYIQNTPLENFVFVVGETEGQSSFAVHADGEAINYVEYENSDYNFDGNAFTIFVPMSFYFSFGGAGIGEVSMISDGIDYLSAPPISFSGGGGSGATAHAVMTGTIVSAIVVDTPGSGYTSLPDVGIGHGSFGSGFDASARAIPFSSTADNTIRAVANRYVIAGMIYNIIPYPD